MKTVVPLYTVELRRSREIVFDEERKCECAMDVYYIFRGVVGDSDREHVLALYLDTQRELIGVHVVSVGSVSEAVLCGREVYKAALLLNAASVVVAHNHPSGEPEPSYQDRARTEVLEHAGVLLGVQLADHVIIGDERYFSFRNAGLLKIPDSDWLLKSKLRDPRLIGQKKKVQKRE